MAGFDPPMKLPPNYAVGKIWKQEEEEVAGGPYWGGDVRENRPHTGHTGSKSKLTALTVVLGSVPSLCWASISPCEKVGDWTG